MPNKYKVNMTGEQFLNSIRNLDYEITALDHTRTRLEGQRQDILDRAMSNAALTGVCVQHSTGSKTEALGVQLADLITPEQLVTKLNRLQARVNRKIDELVDRKRLAVEIIGQVEDARYKAVLTHRYINSLKWATIADLMGYTQNWVEARLKAQAMEAFCEAYQKSQVKTGRL